MSTQSQTRGSAPAPDQYRGGRTIEKWDVENDAFWNAIGSRVASRNLWISVPTLNVAFAVWGMWGMITVQMLNAGFPFSHVELFSITAIAGLTGATLRIPGSFMIRPCGGRNTIFLTTVLLFPPVLLAGWALQDRDTPLWVFQLCAFLSGVGGGNFANSMSNISTFYPKRLQGLGLGINGGAGDFGVSISQLLIPTVMTFALFGPFGGAPMKLVHDSGSLISTIKAGSDTWIQNSSFVWLILIVPMSILSWFGMNNIRSASPGLDTTVGAFGKILLLYATGFIAAVLGLWLYLPPPIGLGLIDMWVVVPLIVVADFVLMYALSTGTMRSDLERQFAIFENFNTWTMTILYIATFGSFIGFSMAVPLSIKVIFGFKDVIDPATNLMHRVVNPEAPSALTYSWIAPAIGALIRPFGGWISDRLGGSVVTQAMLALMVVSAAACGYVMHAALTASDPVAYFWPAMASFIVFLFAAGIGNGSVYRTAGVIFDKSQAGPVIGWISAAAAYGAFLAPLMIGRTIHEGDPQTAMYGLAIFYVVCFALNGWFYLRAGAAIRNP